MATTVGKYKIDRQKLIGIIKEKRAKAVSDHATAESQYPSDLVKWREEKIADLNRQIERLRNGEILSGLGYPPSKPKDLDLKQFDADVNFLEAINDGEVYVTPNDFGRYLR